MARHRNLLGIEADITTLGKIIGGGVPVAAYGGRAELMNHVAPLGPVYQAGTLAGNPLAMSAGIATLKQLAAPGFYEAIERVPMVLADGLRGAAAKAGVTVQVNDIGSLATIFLRRDRCAITAMPRNRIRSVTENFSGACWNRVFFSLLRSLRRRFFPWRTPTRISNVR